MANKTYTIIPNLSTNSDTIASIVTTTTASNSFVLPPSINTTTTTTTTPSLQTLQVSLSKYIKFQYDKKQNHVSHDFLAGSSS